MEAARGLNAYIVETPEKALQMAAESDRRVAAGEARALEGVPLGIKDLFCTDGVHSQAASRILEGYRPVYEFDRHGQSLGRRRGDARQAQHGRVRHGLVERDLGLWAGGQPVAIDGLERAAGAGRFVRRLGDGGGGLPLRRARRRPIRAARSGSRRRSPRPSGSSRPTAAARAGGSSPSPRPSTRRGRLPATCATRQFS